MNAAYERDYKSYPDYETTTYYENREYCQVGMNSPYVNYGRSTVTMTPLRKPQMGVAASHHRRTLSSISATSSNINPAFQLECEESASTYKYGKINQNRHASLSPINQNTNRMRVYENVGFARNEFQPNYTASSPNTEFHSTYDRPDSLPFDNSSGTKLRSSLRKYSNPSPRFATNGSTSGTAQFQQQSTQHKTATTPTKATPPDSLTSDDSSYLSAKDGSISSQSRVRFSPETLLDQPSTNSAIASAVPSTPIRRLSRSQRHSISDMLAPNSSS